MVRDPPLEFIRYVVSMGQNNMELPQAIFTVTSIEVGVTMDNIPAKFIQSNSHSPVHKTRSRKNSASDFIRITLGAILQLKNVPMDQSQ